MRKLLASTLVGIACVTPVMAQDAPQPAVSPVPQDLVTPAPKPTQQQKDAQSIQAIEDGLRTRLAHAGFTDIGRGTQASSSAGRRRRDYRQRDSARSAEILSRVALPRAHFPDARAIFDLRRDVSRSVLGEASRTFRNLEIAVEGR
jgi:hypothetical protein